MHRADRLPSIEFLARRRKFSEALSLISALPVANVPASTLSSYKAFFRGLASSGSRGVGAPASQALETLRSLHRLRPDSELTDQVIAVFRLCRDLDRLHEFLGSHDLLAQPLSVRATAVALETLANAESLTVRDFQLAWSLIEPVIRPNMVEGLAVGALRIARRARWGFSRLARLLSASQGSSVSAAKEAIRAVAVCPDLSSTDAVKIAFTKYIEHDEAPMLKAAIVEVYVRRGMIDHALKFAAEASASADRTTPAIDWWNPLVVAAADYGDPVLTAFVWQYYEPRTARPPLLIAAMAQAAVNTRSGAMAVAALTEVVKRQGRKAGSGTVLGAETVSEIRRLTDATTSVEVKDKLTRLLRVLPRQVGVLSRSEGS